LSAASKGEPNDKQRAAIPRIFIKSRIRVSY
jgi:hypothetical protein